MEDRAEDNKHIESQKKGGKYFFKNRSYRKHSQKFYYDAIGTPEEERSNETEMITKEIMPKNDKIHQGIDPRSSTNHYKKMYIKVKLLKTKILRAVKKRKILSSKD